LGVSHNGLLCLRSAFTSAVALTIIATQLKPLLGLSFPAEEFVETLQGLAHRLDDIKKEVSIQLTVFILTLDLI
jgi:MFS superfamily sulfate permease-like transporter